MGDYQNGNGGVHHIDNSGGNQQSNHRSQVVEVNIVVASLIAAVTFAAIIQIPGGIEEEDKDSVHHGAARMALRGMFKLFLISDVIAFSASMAVLIVWLFSERLQIELGKGRFTLGYLSQLSLVVASIATVFAFLGATILVVIPPNVHELVVKHKKEFEAYAWLRKCLTLLTLIPVVVSLCLALTISAAMRYAFKEVWSVIKPPSAQQQLLLRSQLDHLRQQLQLLLQHVNRVQQLLQQQRLRRLQQRVLRLEQGQPQQPPPQPPQPPQQPPQPSPPPPRLQQPLLPPWQSLLQLFQRQQPPLLHLFQRQQPLLPQLQHLLEQLGQPRQLPRLLWQLQRLLEQLPQLLLEELEKDQLERLEPQQQEEQLERQRQLQQELEQLLQQLQLLEAQISLTSRLLESSLKLTVFLMTLMWGIVPLILSLVMLVTLMKSHNVFYK